MENKILDEVGKILMSEVRDKTILRTENILEGKVRAPELIQLSKKLNSTITGEQIILKELINEITDNLIFNLLNVLEEDADILKLIYVDENTKEYNIVELSDGLAGELFTEDG